MKSNKTTHLPVRDFKKKNLSNTNNTTTQPFDKLSNLKSKINQQKQLMRQSGRRFRQQTARSSQSILTNQAEQPLKQQLINHKTETKTSPMIKKTTQTSIMTSIEPKNQISLTQLGQIKDYNSSSMATSRIFEKQVETQKKKNKELKTFLKELDLQKFYSQFQALGYDDLQTIVQIETEELNHMMMRAHQQDKLMMALKKIRANMGLDQTKDNPSTLSTKSTIPRKRLHTTSALTTNPSTPSRQFMQKRQKQKISPNKNSFSSKSFLYTVGSNFWSVQSQVRRACSSCFKVSQQLTKQGDCFYCPQCFKWIADDCMSLSLSSSMIRSYK